MRIRTQFACVAVRASTFAHWISPTYPTTGASVELSTSQSQYVKDEYQDNAIGMDASHRDLRIGAIFCAIFGGKFC